MKRDGMPRDMLGNEVFRLQQLALHALSPDWAGQKVLPGKATAEDEDTLLGVVKYLPEARETIEEISGKLKDRVDRDLLFAVVTALLKCASLVGSRARVSGRQQSVFAVERAAKAGRNSGRSRAEEARDSWRAEVVTVACRLREKNPHITNEAIADFICENWRLHIPVPARRSVLDFIPTAERDGQLPRKKRRPSPSAKSRSN